MRPPPATLRPVPQSCYWCRRANRGCVRQRVKQLFNLTLHLHQFQPLCRQRRQVFIWVAFHVVPPFACPLPFSPKRLPAACSGVGTLLTVSGHFVPKWLVTLLPPPGYSFSDGHSFFKVLFTGELSQVYIFLTACAVCP